MLHQSGVTEAGTKIIAGCFRLVDEQGLPLEELVFVLRERDYMMDWLDFYDDAMRHGWRRDRTFLRMASAVGDAYGPAFQAEWESRMALHRPH